MIRIRALKSRTILAGAALALTVPVGFSAAAQPAPARKAAKPQFSPAFVKVAADLEKALLEGAKNPAITAASQRAKAAGADAAAKSAAAAEVDTALGGARAKLQAAAAVATTSDDKLKLGEMTRNVGVLMGDLSLQHDGLVQMIGSGAVGPANLGQLQFLAGVTAYQRNDFQTASTYLKPAFDGGYRDAQGLLPQLLADVYTRTNNQGAAAQVAQQELAAAKASGAKPSESAIRGGLKAAFEAKQGPAATALATDLVQYYPSPNNWADAILVVRGISALPSQDNLDLMRLKSRAGGMNSERDYLEYVQNADPRRLPAEVLKVLDAGVASGKVQATNSFVIEARQTASGRLAADRASLPAFERDARAASAPVATVMGAADALLSYEQPAKAEELYKIALGKAGADKDRVLTRLGIAQLDQGKFAEAQQNFGQVQGPRQSVAKLWSLYAASKSGAGAAGAAR